MDLLFAWLCYVLQDWTNIMKPGGSVKKHSVNRFVTNLKSHSSYTYSSENRSADLALQKEVAAK